jgi:hypothetical protein
MSKRTTSTSTESTTTTSKAGLIAKTSLIAVAATLGIVIAATFLAVIFTPQGRMAYFATFNTSDVNKVAQAKAQWIANFDARPKE